VGVGERNVSITQAEVFDQVLDAINDTAKQNTDDTFESIRRYAWAKVRSGEWTREESVEWIQQKDKEEYAASEKRIPDVPEATERVSFTDQGHQTAHGFKETDGSLTYPTPKHLTKWNEHD